MLREQYDAILIGGGTVLTDNPHLTRRLGLNRAIQPWLRVVQVGVGLTLVVVLLLAWARGWAWLADQLPASIQARLEPLRAMGRGGRLLGPQRTPPAFTWSISRKIHGPTTTRK